MKAKWNHGGVLFLALWMSGAAAIGPVRAEAQAFTNRHDFVLSDGTTPLAGLMAVSNILYGTTDTLGNSDGGGAGSAFTLAIDGSSFTNLHTFTGGFDGGELNGNLIMNQGRLYGTATLGGVWNHGCIFVMNPDGSGLTNVYSFTPLSATFPYTNSDGAYPQCGLVARGSNLLFGTASSGGAFGEGAVFAVAADGSGFTNLHSFAFAEGQSPNGVVLSGSTLYGTTLSGGLGYGTIFRLNTDGSGFTNLYYFSMQDRVTHTNADGAFPLGSLLLAGDTLYGTASEGGAWANGTVFRMDTNGGGFRALHYFSATNAVCGNSDGANPESGLILWSNSVYGTAEFGGSGGSGTVFRVNKDGGGFGTLYQFTATNLVTGTNADGAFPAGGLVQLGSVFYGTTSAGGTAGYGTVYSILTPPPLAFVCLSNRVILKWPPEAEGFVLQSATNFAATNWSTMAGPNVVTDTISGPTKFYRLFHP